MTPENDQVVTVYVPADYWVFGQNPDWRQKDQLCPGEGYALLSPNGEVFDKAPREGFYWLLQKKPQMNHPPLPNNVLGVASAGYPKTFTIKCGQTSLTGEVATILASKSHELYPWLMMAIQNSSMMCVLRHQWARFDRGEPWWEEPA